MAQIRAGRLARQAETAAEVLGADSLLLAK
jgi:hypothetical protein